VSMNGILQGSEGIAGVAIGGAEELIELKKE
jgi:hypothetical protein